MKQYLTTPEEVIKALKDEKDVYLEEGGVGKVKLIDGFCVKENEQGFNINYTINLRDKPYINTQDDYEVGESYELKNGKKALCHYCEDCIDILGKTVKVFHFVIIGRNQFFTVNDRGSYYPLDLKNLKIVGKWRDKNEN